MPDGAPVDADLDPGSISFLLDPSAPNEFRVRVRRSDSTWMTGKITLA